MKKINNILVLMNLVVILLSFNSYATVVDILLDTDENLRKIGVSIDNFYDGELQQKLDNMFDTLEMSKGAGLAASQVGYNVRAFVVFDKIKGCMKYADGDISITNFNKPMEFLNPQIIFTDGQQLVIEGCLSIPNKIIMRTRPQFVKIKACDRNGREFVFETEDGFTAKLLCHENDHLDGVLCKDKALKVFDKEEFFQSEEYKTIFKSTMSNPKDE